MQEAAVSLPRESPAGDEGLSISELQLLRESIVRVCFPNESFGKVFKLRDIYG